jgi:hypothetical protein
MINLTVASPDISVYGSNNVEAGIPPGRYVDHCVEVTLTSGYTQSPRVQRLSDDSVFAQLGPLERWRYLARHHLGEFIVYLLALIGGTYMLVRAAIHLGPNIFPSAFAQNGLISCPASVDALTWYVAGLMGLCLLCSLGIIMFAQKPSKISLGGDATKMILGFVLGFLSGEKTR